MKLREFYRLLDAHDWLYQYADDPGAYRNGAFNEAHLERISTQSDEHLMLFDAFRNHKVYGVLPKPAEPPHEDG